MSRRRATAGFRLSDAYVSCSHATSFVQKCVHQARQDCDGALSSPLVWAYAHPFGLHVCHTRSVSKFKQRSTPVAANGLRNLSSAELSPPLRRPGDILTSHPRFSVAAPSPRVRAHTVRTNLADVLFLHLPASTQPAGAPYATPARVFRAPFSLEPSLTLSLLTRDRSLTVRAPAAFIRCSLRTPAHHAHRALPSQKVLYSSAHNASMSRA
ncbi:hypothetical protein C8Q73DRAFT_82062 [Cubamyces lactineus]|nr:hypothetical protein C8Q73DRAFT_82062 [Cubamyces lactineus]